MEQNFSRIITLLRKQKKLSQKQVATDLGISQALLSHYEKGIRECGLQFIVKIANYYNVSCDYLLGRSPEPSGTTISVEDIDTSEDPSENKYKGSLLPILNKKLIINSLHIIFDLLQKLGNKTLTNEISSYLMLSVYKMFRIIYSLNSQNPQGFFSIDFVSYRNLISATQDISEAHIISSIPSTQSSSNNNSKCENTFNITPDYISNEYKIYASSLYNLIQTSEIKVRKYK